MSGLASALDALVDTDLHALSAGAQLDRIRDLARARNRLDAELARSIRAAETTQAAEHDGHKTMASWLRGHCHYAPRAAGLLVRNGRALAHLPTVAAACAAGLITADQLTIIAPIAAPDRLAQAAAQGVDLAGIEQALVDAATGPRYYQLPALVHHYLNRLDPDGDEPDPTEGRALRITRHADGSRSGTFDLDLAGGEKLDTALESLVQAGRCAGDTRTRAQQLADALVQLADLALAGGGLPTTRTSKPHMLVTLSAHDLIDARAADVVDDAGRSDGADDLLRSPGLAESGFGALLSTQALRHLACDSVLTRILLDPDGVPIHHGRTRRVVSPQLRRVVVLRDQHCVFAGCDAPHYWCDVHHVVHWLDGGETEPDNSGLLCERHHTQVHHGFRIQRDPDGRWHTYRPDGTEIIVYEPLRA